MIYTDATDQVLAVLDDFKIAAFENDEQYEALANAIRKAIAMRVRPGMADPLQDPGVQGLAQLGRNAIEHTSSLERTIATLQMRLRRAGQLLIEEIGACGPENADDTAERAAGVIRKQADAIATLSSQLGNLLAVIHRDGGHYEAEHGTEKASDDAITAVHVLRGSLEGYIEANRYMKGELDDAMEDARKYAEAKGEIARLRDALARVAAPARSIAAHAADAMTAKDIVISALLDTLRQWQYAEDNNDRDELANARTNRDEALAQVAEVGK